MAKEKERERKRKRKKEAHYLAIALVFLVHRATKKQPAKNRCRSAIKIFSRRGLEGTRALGIARAQSAEKGRRERKESEGQRGEGGEGGGARAERTQGLAARHRDCPRAPTTSGAFRACGVGVWASASPSTRLSPRARRAVSSPDGTYCHHGRKGEGRGGRCRARSAARSTAAPASKRLAREVHRAAGTLSSTSPPTVSRPFRDRFVHRPTGTSSSTRPSTANGSELDAPAITVAVAAAGGAAAVASSSASLWADEAPVHFVVEGSFFSSSGGQARLIASSYRAGDVDTARARAPARAQRSRLVWNRHTHTKPKQNEDDERRVDRTHTHAHQWPIFSLALQVMQCNAM